MNAVFPWRSIRHLRRYQEIVRVFIRHGFGFIFDHRNMERKLPARYVFRRPPAGTLPLPAEDLAIHLRQALEELGPTFIKLGQILSTRPDLLPPPFLRELTRLQDSVSPVPWEIIRRVLIEEYGREPEEYFAALDPQPLATASLSQVHTAVLANGEAVVIKVQRPNILSTISTDLEILDSLARTAQNTAWGKIYDFAGIAEDFSYTLRNELDYRREGRNADRFRKNFSREQYLYIPHVYWEYTSKRVLVLERLKGIKIDDLFALDAAGYDRHQVALNSARIIIKEVLEDSFFHADPHPGNFIVMPGEIIGAMDFGMVGHFSERDRTNLIRLYYAVSILDEQSIVEELIRMGAAGPDVDRPSLGRDLGRLLSKYHGLALKDIRVNEIFEEAMPVAFRHHLSIPSDLWLLGKTLAMMEGIGLQLDPAFDIFAVSEPYAQRLVWQQFLPRREWARTLMNTGMDWSDLLHGLPRTGSRLLERAERGDLFQVQLKEAEPIMKRLDRLATRLALSVLIAALIISLAMLIPQTASGGPLQPVIIVGFIVAAGLGIWLLLSILRGKQ